ncbi:hypothetical protein PENTCL1PPCAC_7413 [Pristionchus entomophagus]|uniref:Phosphatidic acid phosphatase type 2/haloperoxidase domain-containing protein n=1 Tax=Pristionchus entomophagus TaxID=358040 RepID=A0AAV5ST16_9BILA|nr:hypothetical protein PENTCL1PPCAC_7413 [Pristionchus entomophagus]
MGARKTVQLSLIVYVISAVCMYVLAAVSLVVPGLVGARTSPFACDDYSIRNPLKKQTVSTTALILITLLAALLIIIVTEVVIDRLSLPDRLFKWRRWRLPSLLVHAVAYLGYFQLGYAMQVVVNQVTKYAVGRLRPHFFTVCKPEAFNCTSPGQLIYSYTCTGDAKDTEEGRLSFFSGHSSIAMYSATFLIIYLHARIGHIAPRILLSTLQTVLFTGGLFICYTRLQDYYHHPSDIATGAVIGILGAIYSCYAWADLWYTRNGYSAVHGQISEEDDDDNPSAVNVDSKTNPELVNPPANIYNERL